MQYIKISSDIILWLDYYHGSKNAGMVGIYNTTPHCIAGLQVQQHPPKREPEREEWTEVLANGGHQEQY